MRFLHPESPRLPARRTPASAQPPRGGSVPSSVCLDGMAVCRRSFEMSPSRSPDDAVAFVFPWRPGAVLRRPSWMRPLTEPFQSPSGLARRPLRACRARPPVPGRPPPEPSLNAQRSGPTGGVTARALRWGGIRVFGIVDRLLTSRGRSPFLRAAAARRRRTTPPAERAPSRVEPVATRDGAQKARSMAGGSGRLGGDDGAPVAKPSRCT
jgi:hypothetical protein